MTTDLSVFPGLEGTFASLRSGSDIVHYSNVDKERGILKCIPAARQVNVPIAWEGDG